MKSRKRWSQQEIVDEFNKIHNYFYKYDKVNYTKMHGKITITCPNHGDFEQEANQHFRGQGCRRCSTDNNPNIKPDTTEEFVTKAKQIFSTLYDYSKTVYGKNAHEPVIVICNKHGEFTITPNQHLSKKAGCSICARLSGGWSRERYIDYAKGRLANLYLIRCYNEEEEFYKIGITFKDLKHRLGYKSRLPYNYELISSITSYDIGYIYDLERDFINKFHSLRYMPKIFFDGANECFTPSIDIIKTYADTH